MPVRDHCVLHLISVPRMKFRWSLAPPQPRLAAQLAGALQHPAAARPMPAEPRPERAGRHRGFPPAPAQATGRSVPAAEHGRRRRAPAPGPRNATNRSSSSAITTWTASPRPPCCSKCSRPLGWNVHYYLPHRMDEGYGLSQDGVENCLAKFPATLLLAVDCGSTAVATIAWLRAARRGRDRAGPSPGFLPAPAATALVNPQLGVCRQPRSAHGSTPATHATLQPVNSSPPSPNSAPSASPSSSPTPSLKRGRETGSARRRRFRPAPPARSGRPGHHRRHRPADRREPHPGLRRPGAPEHHPAARAGRPEAGRPVPLPCSAPTKSASSSRPASMPPAAWKPPKTPCACSWPATWPKPCPSPRTWTRSNRERQKIERGIADEVIGAVRARFNPQTDFVIVEGQLLLAHRRRGHRRLARAPAVLPADHHPRRRRRAFPRLGPQHRRLRPGRRAARMRRPAAPPRRPRHGGRA